MNRESLAITLISALAMSSCSVPVNPTTYAQAQIAFWAQPMNSQRDAYMAIWDQSNESHKLDQKDGCYKKSVGASANILAISASGEVVGFFSDPSDARAACLRHSYLGVHFRKPPYVPFYVHLDMGAEVRQPN